MEVNSKELVLRASLELISEHGLAGLSLREVARRAGMSHQAPYHYFSDKESVVAELVRRGFSLLAERMEATAAQTLADDRLENVGRDYVEFALDHPVYFQLMFRSELVDLSRFPETRKASERTFNILQQLVVLMYGAQAPQATIEVLVSMHWAVVHGLATLFLEGDLGQRYRTSRKKKDHLKEVLKLFVQQQTMRPGVSRP